MNDTATMVDSVRRVLGKAGFSRAAVREGGIGLGGYVVTPAEGRVLVQWKAPDMVPADLAAGYRLNMLAQYARILAAAGFRVANNGVCLTATR